MSLLPAFLPSISAYRADLLSFVQTEDLDTTSAGGTFAFSSDGTVLLWDREESQTTDWTVARAVLGTPWDASTRGAATAITFADLGPASTRGFIGGMQFFDGGTTLFGGLRRTSDGFIYKYSLASAYDGATTPLQSLLISNPFRSFRLSGNGTRLHVLFNDDTVQFATLGTPYDLTTASGFAVERDFGLSHTGLQAMCYGKTERQFFVADTTQLHEYRLGTAGNVSTATFIGSFSLSDSAAVDDISFGEGGRRFFALATNLELTEWESVG